MEIKELQNKVPKGSQKRRYRHPLATDNSDKYIGKWEKYDKPQGINSKAAKEVLKGNKVSEGIRTDVEVTPIPLEKAKKVIKNAVAVVYASTFTVGNDTYITYAEKDSYTPGLFQFGFNIVDKNMTSTPEVFVKTGENKALRVYSGAASALLDFINKYSPPAIELSGAFPKQDDIYINMVKRLDKQGNLGDYFVPKRFKYPTMGGIILQHKYKSLKESNTLPGGPWPQQGDFKPAPTDVIPNDVIIDFFGDNEDNPGSKAPVKYTKKQNRKLNTDSYKKPFEESSLATSKGYKSATKWESGFIPDPKDAPPVVDFNAPGKGENGIRFIIDLGIKDEMKDKARKKDNRNNKSVKQVTEMVRRPSQRDFSSEYEIVSNTGKEEEVIGKAIVEDGVITVLAAKEASSRPTREILTKLVGSIAKEADLSNANLSIRVEDRHDLDIVRFLERFGFRHVGEGILKRNAGSNMPPLN